MVLPGRARNGGVHRSDRDSDPVGPRDTADEIRSRPDLELVREPDLSIILFRRNGWTTADYTAWAGGLLADQVAFIPPWAWDGETVGRFAFLHPHTTMDLVREILDRTA